MEVATVVVLDRHVSMGIPASGVTGVETWIDEVASLSPIRGFSSRHLGRWVEDVGSPGFGCWNPDGSVGDGDIGNLDATGVGEHEQSHRLLCRPGICEFPGCGAIARIPVVQAVSATVGPRQQVGPAFLKDRGTVEGDGPCGGNLMT